MQSNSSANITNHHGQFAQCQYYNSITPRQWKVILVCPTPFLLTVSFKTPKKFHSLVGWQEFCFYVVICPPRWSLHLSLALCVDHLSIIPTETRVQQRLMIFSGKFGDFVEKSHAKIYATQTKGWMALPELKRVTTTLEKVHFELKITFFTFRQSCFWSGRSGSWSWLWKRLVQVGERKSQVKDFQLRVESQRFAKTSFPFPALPWRALFQTALYMPLIATRCLIVVIIICQPF